MATLVKHTVKTIHCQRVKRDVALVEERIYPSDILPDAPGAQFWVRGRKCEMGIECNLVGLSCKWSGMNPDYDPFAL